MTLRDMAADAYKGNPIVPGKQPPKDAVVAIFNEADTQLDAVRERVADVEAFGGTIADQVTRLTTAEADIDVLQAANHYPSILKSTWTALAAITGSTAGQRGEVTGPDAGTHTDPVVGGSVANKGLYSWSASPAGWKWEADNALGTLTTQIQDAPTLSVLSLAADEGMVRDYRKKAQVVRDLNTAANNKAGQVTASFARALAAYRVNGDGNFQSVGSGVLRYQYDKDGNPLGVLIERQRIVKSLRNHDGEFGNALWTKSNVTLTAGALSYRGYTFTKVEAATSAGTSFNMGVSSAGSASGNTIVFVCKKGSGATEANKFNLYNPATATNLRFFSINWDTLAVTDIIGTGGVTVTDLGGGVIEVRIEHTTGISAGQTLSIYPFFTSQAEAAGEYAYLAYVAVLDTMGPTSRIDTVAAHVTRPPDVLTQAVSAFHFDTAKGSMFVEWGAISPYSTRTVLRQFDDGSEDNVIALVMDASGHVSAEVKVSGTNGVALTSGVDLRGGGSAYLAWKANDVELVVNGVSVGVDTSVAIPTGITTDRLGSNSAGGQQPSQGVFCRDQYWSRRLAQAEMVTPTVNDADSPIVRDGAGKIDEPLSATAAARSVYQGGGVVYEKTDTGKQQIFLISGNGETKISDGAYNDRYPTIAGDGVRFSSDRDGATLRVMRMLRDGKSVVSERGLIERVILIIGYGQSRSIGSASAAQTPNQLTTAQMLGSVLMFNDGPRPLGSAQTITGGGQLLVVQASDIDRLIPAAAIRDSSAYGETHLETLAYRLMSSSNQRSIIAAPGIGGATYAQLAKGTPPYSNLLAIVSRAQSIIGRLGWPLEVVVTWDHGESNQSDSRAVYAGKLRTLYSDLLADITAITRQTAFHMFSTPPATLNASQVPLAHWDISKEIANFHLIGPCYDLPYVDSAHETYIGYSLKGDLYWRALKTVLIDGATWKPLQPISAVRSAAQIDLLFEGHTGNIILDTTSVSAATSSGLEFWDDSGAPPAITNVATITNGVRITLASTPSGGNQVVRAAYTRPGTVPDPAGIARTNIADQNTLTATYDGRALPKRAINFEIAVTT